MAPASPPMASPESSHQSVGPASAPTTPSRTRTDSKSPSGVSHGRSNVAATASRCIKDPSAPALVEDDADRSRSSAGDNSIIFSSGGSVVYHPRMSDSSVASNFEILSVTESVAALNVGPDSSLSSSTSQVKAGPPRASTAAMSSFPVEASPGRTARTRHAPVESTPRRSRTMSASLNPAAAAFSAQQRPSRHDSSGVAHLFSSILRSGKNLNGDLTVDAKTAMAAHGLKPIPSLHGTSLLPYSRNPSGSDAFRFTVENDEHGFEPIPDSEIEFHASQRTLPLPLPGNARYTPAGRQVLAQQRRVVSAPTPSDSVMSGSSRQVEGSTRRVVTAPVPSSSTPDASVPSIGPTPATRAAIAAAQQQQYQRSIMEQLQQAQARDEAFAKQAHLAHQVPQYQLAPSSSQPGPFLPQPFSPYLSAQASTSAASEPFGAPVQPGPQPFAYPISGFAASLGPSTSYGGLQAQRRSSILITPEGQIAFVDSAMLLQLAGQQVVEAHEPVALGSRATDSAPSSRTTSYGAVLEMDSAEEQALSEEGPDVHLAALAASTSGRRRPSRAEQLDRRRRKHRPTLSDATVTAQTYVEQGRRKSAVASFPPPGGWRRPSVASSLAPEPRHASSSAAAYSGTRSASISGGHAATRTSLRPTDSRSASGSSEAYRPPMVRRRSSSQSGSEHDYSAPTLEGPSRVLSSIGNVPPALSAKVGSHPELHATFQLPPSAPIVQVEPPTPKPVRTSGRSTSAFSPQAVARNSVVTANSGVPTFRTASINSGSSDGTVTPGGDDRAGPVVSLPKGKGYHGRGKRREPRQSDPTGRSSGHL
ncbi:hypothetical protein JCM3775_005566 [Rhodotorula graminis]